MLQINNTLSNNINAMGTTGAAQRNTNQADTQQEEIKMQQTGSAAAPVNSVPTAVASVDKISGSEPEISAAYSVEISEEGARLSAMASVGSATGTSTDDTAATVSPSDTAKPANAPRGNQAASSIGGEDSIDSSTTDLSQYSESQLQQMVNSGAITQAEYVAEIASRKQQEQQEQGEQNSQAPGSAMDAVQ